MSGPCFEHSEGPVRTRCVWVAIFESYRSANTWVYTLSIIFDNKTYSFVFCFFQQQLEVRLREKGLCFVDGGQTLCVQRGESVTVQVDFNTVGIDAKVDPVAWVG